ncbi:MAG: glycosyltransferase 61 family protein [Paracoccaceae bacterium]|uniref:glycosyltransferase 61 family protein n=1 Tax=Seohaeicola saemankumensis TaxID=481181 RepID=UPI001E4C6DA9|nr:glycosyltransferase 61 family protein [Seohaeicola saemankumensis]MCD1627869.1 glycosyltransferase family 61 protein [Seohaeicola saemankumensis]
MRKFFVTPFLIEGSDVAGALYSDTLQIELASLRNSQSAAFRHRDPAYLFPKEVRDAVNLNKDFLFLGHNFTQYGHFILETLPMLTALLESKDVSGFFLPWGSRDDLLYSSLALLDIDSSRVYVHREKSVVTSRFRIIDRPIVINNSLVSMSSYYPVVARLKEKAVHSSKSRLPKKIFLDRKPDRVSIEIYERVASFFVKNGFTRIRPEQYSLLEQVRIFSLANDVASFPGSQLHNTIFSSSYCRVIEVGDTRSPMKSLENQVICDLISGVKKIFVPYAKDSDDLLSSIFRIL